MMNYFSILKYQLVWLLILAGSCDVPGNAEGENLPGKANTVSNVSQKPAEGPTVSRDVLTEAYIRAIAEYIKVMKQKGTLTSDTLFIGKHPDFPDIQLPPIIEQTPTLLATYKDAQKRPDYYKSLVYLNVIGWVEQDKSEFIIVTFFAGGQPQHNCHLYFIRHLELNELELDSLGFDYPYAGPPSPHATSYRTNG